MYINKSKFLVLTLSGSFLFSGCSLKQMIKMAKEQELTVTPSPLELHGDSVKGTMSAILPVKMLKKNKVYVVNSKYVSGDKVVELGDLTFQQNPNFPNAKTEKPILSKNFAFAYNENLKRGELKVMGSAFNMSQTKKQSTPEMPIAKGIITTSKLFKYPSYALYAAHGYNNNEELAPTNISFGFEKGKSTLRKSEKSSDNGKYFEAFIAKKNVTRIVSITGSHSPEGTELVNTSLSNDRAKVIETFYRENMAKYKYNKGTQDSIQFVLKAQVKDWVAFKDLVTNDSKLSASEKTELLAIVNAPAGDFEQKEKILQTTSSYKYLVKEIYPRLRTAKTEILTVKPKKSEAEIATLAKMVGEGKLKKDTLTTEELLYAATLTPLNEEKEAIYKKVTVDSDKWETYNNLGALYVSKAQKAPKTEDKKSNAELAIAQLTLANQKQETEIAYTNIAAAYLLKEDHANALISANKAISLAKDSDVKKAASGIAGACEIRNGNYVNAISHLLNADATDATVKYDLALAYLLSKNYDKAKLAFDDATTADPNNALAYYGSAITAARTNTLDILTARLAKAVKLDEKLRAKALEDLEFMNYWNNNLFKEALK
ncbi:MAG: tetratricopeptide repeat protein [Cytophagales bacterium]